MLENLLVTDLVYEFNDVECIMAKIANNTIYQENKRITKMEFKMKCLSNSQNTLMNYGAAIKNFVII